MIRFVTIVLFLAASILPFPRRGIGENSTDAARKHYSQLISQLVSPNKPATTRNGADASVKFPPGYDVKAQQQIDATRHVLYDNIEEALPYLAGALDDNRYCMTISWADGDAYYNKSVGDICRDVIASRLEIYRDKIRFGDSAQWNHYSFPITKTWLAKRKGRSLAELQREAIQWAMDRSKNDNEDIRLDDEEVAELRELRAVLLKSGKAVKPQRLGMLRMVVRDQ